MTHKGPRNAPPQQGDELDALLSAFFKAELPRPWPAFRRPGRSRLSFADEAPRRRWQAVASRLALAASVALLLLGSWLLPQVTRRPDTAPFNTLGRGSATRGAGVSPAGAVTSESLEQPRGGGPTSIRIEVEETSSDR